LTLHDDDLRRALAPLAGDPAADAARVLRALAREPIPETPPPAPRLPWWVPFGFGAAAAAGLLAGLLLARRTTPEPVPPIQPPDQPPVEVVKDPKSQLGARLLVAMGPSFYLRGQEKQKLEVGGLVPVGYTIATDAYSKAAFHLPCGSILYVNRDTRLSLSAPRELSLQRGQLFLEATRAEKGVSVHSELGHVVIGSRSADVRVETEAMYVVSLSDDVLVFSRDGLQRKPGSMRMVEVRDGLIRDPKWVSPGTYEWTFEMFAATMPDEGVTYLVNELVASLQRFDDPDLMLAEIKSFGARALPHLRRHLDELKGKEEKVRGSIAGAIAEVADPQDLRSLLDLLADENPEVRVRIFQAVNRLTYIDLKTAPQFWREAPEDERQTAIERLRKELFR
jgi:hypothetical protein